MISVCPGDIKEPLFISFAQITVFVDTLNIFAICERESPSRTTYMLIWSDVFGFSSISASVPDGPISESRASLLTMIISPPPFDGFGSIFNAARSIGSVWELYELVILISSFFDKENILDTKENIPALAYMGAINIVIDKTNFMTKSFQKFVNVA